MKKVATTLKGAGANALPIETSKNAGHVDHPPSATDWEELGATPDWSGNHGGPGNALAAFGVAHNHQPTSTNDSVGTLEDTPKLLGLTDFGSYADTDGDPLAAVQITALASHGSLLYDTTGIGDWARVTLDQVVSASDITAGRLRFVPGHDENGVPYATIGFRVGDGTDFTASAYTLRVNVAAVNDAPVAHDDSTPASEGDTVTINVLGNDSDVDSPLSPASITGFSLAAHGAAIYNGDGTFSYSHDGSETTSDSFTYTITDNHGAKSTATVHVTVNPVNDAPVIVSPNGGAPATIAVAESTTAVTDVDATDVDGGALSYSILPTADTDFGSFTIDPATGVLSFVAAPDFEHPTDVGGTDGDNAYVVEVQASDGQGGTDSQSITVNVQNVTTSPPNTTADTVITNAGAFGTIFIEESILLQNDYGPESDPIHDPLHVANVSGETGGVVLHVPFLEINFTDDGALGGSFDYMPFSSSAVGPPATVTIENHPIDTTVLTGGAGDDIIISADINGDYNNGDRLNGAGGSDQLFGLSGNDVLDGGAGDDIIDGGTGFDLLDFSDGTSGITFTLVQDVFNFGVADLSAAGLGRDAYFAMEGVIGTAFGDTLAGSGMGDMIDGGAGNDIIDGGAGNDMIFAGAGNDIIVGGAGNDTFTFTNGTGNDTIIGFEAGGPDDILDITAFGFADFSAILAATTNVNGNAVIALDADDSLTLVGVNPTDLHSNDFYFLA
jgi:VCBS repeat-containing protein